MGGQVVVDLHKANGDQPVEPSVGDLLQDVLVGRGIVAVLLLLADDLHQSAALADGFAGDGVGLGGSNVIERNRSGRLRKGGFDALRRDAHEPRAVLDVRDQLVPRPDREIFYGCLVHGVLLSELSHR